MTADNDMESIGLVGYAIRELPYETVFIQSSGCSCGRHPALILRSEPKIDDEDIAGLNIYRERCIARLNEAVLDDPDEFYIGNVTFNTIVNDSYINILDNNYDIKFLDLKLRGRGTKSGKTTTVDKWPKDTEWLFAQQNFVRTELQDPDFTIDLGNIAARIWAKASILQNLRDSENNVFNIDIGPYDILKEFLIHFPRERLVLFSKDIAWEKGL